MSADTRAMVLGRVRASLAGARAAGPSPGERRTWSGPSWEPALGERVETFRQRLESVGGNVWLPRDATETQDVLARVLDGAAPGRIAVSDADSALALLHQYTRERPEITVTPWSDGRTALMEADVGVTQAQYGIAETGTLVLESCAERHRLVSLLPAVHIALLPVAAILGTLGEALAKIRIESGAVGSRTITFITGPSRTADIELTLVVGVHGPKELHVILTPETPS